MSFTKLTTLALFAFTGTSAMAAPLPSPSTIECRTNSGIRDAGTRVLVESFGHSGAVAKVFETTIRGERQVGVANTRLVYANGSNWIVGNRFELRLSEKASRAYGNPLYQATFRTLIGERAIAARMLCTVTEPTGPMMGCLAYFQGYIYDIGAGKCVKMSSSGCSNPFPHKTLESCQGEAALR